MSDVAGLVLAAGAGRRMGGPKALVRSAPDGPTWVEQAVCRVAAAGVGPVVVAVGAEAEAVIEVLRSGRWALGCDLSSGVHLEVIEVANWSEGMGASLRAGLRALADPAPGGVEADAGGGALGIDDDDDGDDEDGGEASGEGLDGRPGRRSLSAVLITLVDLPDVGTEVHRRVLEAARAAGELRAGLVRAAYGGVPGHPVLVGREHWKALSDSVFGDRGARDCLRGRDVTLVECGDLATGADVDQPRP